MLVLTLVFPDPPKVKLLPVVIASGDLFKVKVPESEFILESEFIIIFPP